MAAKLKLTLKRIHWSLALKAAVFGLAWLTLPFWLFLVLAFYFYFFPFFRAGKLLYHFILALFFASLLPHSFLAAVFLSLIMFLILGVKDLILVNRSSAYRLLIFFLTFLMFFEFFSNFSNAAAAAALWWLFLLSFSIFILLAGLLDYSAGGEIGREAPPRRRGTVMLIITCFLIFELGLVLLFMPLAFYYQVAVSFAASALLIEIILDYWARRLNRKKILINSSILFGIVAVILALADWRV